MKGMVFTEFLEMVEARWSPDLVDDLVEAADLPSGGRYTSVGTYGHEEMVTLVRGLSERTGIPVPELIRAFGRHLFGRFSVTHPRLFQGAADAFGFLEGIESLIHAEVLKLYPDAMLPRFDVTRDGDRMTLVYHSSRHFEDLAHGLIEGCLEHFGTRATLARAGAAQPDGGIRFDLARLA
jgi:hypothetical protein